MKSKRIIIFISIVIFIIFSLFISMRYIENNDYKKKGMKLIIQIEKYKKLNNHLPNSISDLDILESMDEGPYYEKEDSINYIVFFNIGFDNTKKYYSRTKQWEDF